MREYLGYHLTDDIEIISESKADDTYPVVSAASICAKVTRDHLLVDWEFKEKTSVPYSRVFGCGYPGDVLTKTWLKDHFDEVFGFPTVVRFSWKTCKTILDDKHMAANWFDPDPNAKPKVQAN